MNLGKSIQPWSGGLRTHVALWAGLCLLNIAAGQAIADPAFVPGRLLVKPKPALTAHQIQAIYTKWGAQEIDSIPQINVRIVHVPEAHQAKVLEALKHNPNLEFAEQDGIIQEAYIPNDPLLSSE